MLNEPLFIVLFIAVLYLWSGLAGYYLYYERNLLGAAFGGAAVLQIGALWCALP